MLYEFFSNDLNFIILGLAVSLIVITIITYCLKKRDLKLTTDMISEKFLPKDEVHSLKQAFYITMVIIGVLSIVLNFYSGKAFWIETSLLDVIFSFTAILVILSEKPSYIRIIPLTLLVPINSFYYLIYKNTDSLYYTASLFYILNIIHVIIIVLAMIFFVYEFKKHTKNNNLGLTIILLMTIVSVSLFLTIFFEGTSVLDSLTMVTNAFTSNGYTVLGTSTVGKIDSLFLTWGGFILSGVGTATLTAAILSKTFDTRLNSIKNEFNEYKKENKKLKMEIKKLIEKLD